MLDQSIKLLIAQIAPLYHLDPALICAQVLVESSGNPSAMSPCGAKGLMQLMPKTWAWLGGEPGKEFEAKHNLHAGCKYLAGLRKRYAAWSPDEGMKLALAAYNGGPGYVAKAIRLAGGTCPSWKAVATFLADSECVVGGKTPDHVQITNYVARIWSDYKPGSREDTKKPSNPLL